MWREFFHRSSAASLLESELNLTLVEHQELPSSANTDVSRGVIHLNISQKPLKAALSYAYELMNFKNKQLYQRLNQAVQDRKLNRSTYIHKILGLEAEAVFFRCQVFREMGLEDVNCPFRKDYLTLYDEARSVNEAKLSIVTYMKQHGLVRQTFPVGKYYSDSFFYYRNNTPMPECYSKLGSTTVWLFHDAKKEANLDVREYAAASFIAS